MNGKWACVKIVTRPAINGEAEFFFVCVGGGRRGGILAMTSLESSFAKVNLYPSDLGSMPDSGQISHLDLRGNHLY